MKNYQVTVGYRAVICIDLKAQDEKQAKEKAMEIMKKQRDKMFQRNDFNLQDDTFRADGIVDMDETWNML